MNSGLCSFIVLRWTCSLLLGALGFGDWLQKLNMMVNVNHSNKI